MVHPLDRRPSPGGSVAYDGDTAISGVPGTAAAIVLDFAGTEGSACGALLPTGRVRDVIDGVEVTCVDNGMPVVVVRASDLGVTGDEDPADLGADDRLRDRIQSLRRHAGRLMGLGDVGNTSVPKTTLVAAPRAGGAIATRTFIPLRVHDSIGVLGAVTVATALLMDGAVGHDLAELPAPGAPMSIEHPTGRLTSWSSSTTPPIGPRSAGRASSARPASSSTGPSFPALEAPMAPMHEIAHMAHVELLTPEPERSLWFFTEVMGLTENGSEGESVYLRAWDDYEHHTLKLTAHTTSGVRRTGLRASSREALDRRVKAIKQAGYGIGWRDGDPGLGPTYVFRDPDGHELEIYWESEWGTRRLRSWRRR
ncbi:PrpF domain-containing protein [Actinoallomurus sp. NPDC052274]|uniref:PrpF domain-containing protein n=1 Tax=Actinoallomurus sp. NPDC052274 TaxID=3155420 RepID=UPI00342728A2